MLQSTDKDKSDREATLAEKGFPAYVTSMGKVSVFCHLKHQIEHPNSL